MRSVHIKSWLAAAAVVALTAISGCGGNDLPGPVANADSSRAIRTALSSASDTTGADGEAASTGTGWATLRGRFVFDGTPPQRPPYNVTRDPHFCTDGGKPPLQEALVVQSGSNGIKNVAVYLRRASRVHESHQASAEPLVLDQKMCLFVPHVFPALVGRPVHLKNSDPEGHNTKFGTFNSTIANGTFLEYMPQKEEAMPQQVSCSIHPWMSAWLLSRANPYVAISNDDGTFELANLPAGEELEFQVWHESAAGTGGSLDPGTPETRSLKWSNRGRFKITLQPDEVKEIPVTVPATAFKGV